MRAIVREKIATYITEEPGRRRVYLVALFAIGAVFYAMNCLATLKADDILFTFVPGSFTERCDSLWKVLASQGDFYRTMNGRVADVFSRTFSGVLGKSVFNVANTLVLMVFLSLLTRSFTRCATLPALLLATTFVWLVFPVPGETLLWLAGSCNYLWSCALSLALMLYLEYRGSASHRWWHLAALGVWAFVAGGMNESVSSACAAGMALYFLLNPSLLRRGGNAVALLCYLAGLAIIVISPAAWQRLDAGGAIDLNAGAMALLTRRAVNTATKTAHYITPALALLAIAAVWWRKGFAAAVKRNWWNCLMIGAFVSVVVFSLTSHRTYSWFATAGFVVSARWLWPAVTRRKAAHLAAAALLLIAVAWSSATALHGLGDYRNFHDAMETAIKRSPDGVVPQARYEGPENRWVWRMYYENDNAISAYNPYLSNYYGKSNVQFLSPGMLSRYRSELPLTHNAKPLPFRSLDPQMADSLLELTGENYAIVPLKVKDALAATTYCAVQVTDVKAVYTDEQLKQRQRFGVSNRALNRSFYCLGHDGRCYVVVADWPPGVTKLELPLTINKRDTVLRFERSPQPEAPKNEQ